MTTTFTSTYPERCNYCSYNVTLRPEMNYCDSRCVLLSLAGQLWVRFHINNLFIFYSLAPKMCDCCPPYSESI